MIHSDREDNALVRSLVLMSAMSTAADLVQGMAARRNGDDPTHGQEPAVTRPYLESAAVELDEHLIALRAGRVLRRGKASTRRIRFARSVNEVLLLNRIARLFHGIHQRLLSLYPAVPDELVEQARILEKVFGAARDRVGPEATHGLLEEAEIFNVALRALVADDSSDRGSARRANI